jgi:hypothetical protein
MENDQLILLRAILAELKTISNALQQSSMGFCPPPSRYIFCNRTVPGTLWYEMRDREVAPLREVALKGFLRELKFKQMERRGKETWKMLLRLEAAGGSYTLETGHNTNFAKCILSSVAAMTPEQVAGPITIMPTAADADDTAMFCTVFCGAEQVFAPYNDQTDWKTVSAKAVNLVSLANQPS